MRARVLFLGVVAASLCVGTRAWAWGNEGHEIVAAVASQGLSAQAKKQVEALLGGPELRPRMAYVSTWADEMRSWQRARRDAQRNRQPLPPLPEYFARDAAPVAQSFAEEARNEGQPDWHFVNLPLGTPAYRPGGIGTRKDDIVQTIRRCTLVLQGKAGAGEHLTPQQALRLLIHYVGDLHQPLHTACGYWIAGANGQLFRATPGQAARGVHDRGGNSVVFGGDSRRSLHSLWDGPMVRAAKGRNSTEAFINALVSDLGGADVWKELGDAVERPAVWASEVAGSAQQAYEGLTILGGEVTSGPQGRSVRIDATLPPTYEQSFSRVARNQLARAGFRLAALLNAIWP